MKLTEDMIKSRAGVLFCLDYLVHHISDEEHQIAWMMDGIPDDVWANAAPLTDEQLKPYRGFALDESAVLDFNAFVEIAVRLIYRECFKVRYERDGLT